MAATAVPAPAAAAAAFPADSAANRVGADFNLSDGCGSSKSEGNSEDDGGDEEAAAAAAAAAAATEDDGGGEASENAKAETPPTPRLSGEVGPPALPSEGDLELVGVSVLALDDLASASFAATSSHSSARSSVVR